MTRTAFDAIVIGGGLVGAAIGYGLQRGGLHTLLLDEGDIAHRASRGNFGLIWVQSKGLGAPHYQRWTRGSAEEWPALADDLLARTGIDARREQPGGVTFCLGEQEFEQRSETMARMKAEAGNFGFDYRMIRAAEARDMLPGIGPEVTGVSWTPYDGHASPLHLLRALHDAFTGLGGCYRPNAGVTETTAAPNDFSVTAAGIRYTAPRVVLAAGLGNAPLAPRFGLNTPVEPQRGQILVTERTQSLLPMPTVSLRQTAEGSIMIGDSKEDAGFDTVTQTPDIMRTMAQRAVACFPWVAELNIVRAWSALRVMAPDGLPIYDQSDRFPGAFTANCHSGVTLAGTHANRLAPMIAAGRLDPELSLFSARRFDVPAAA
ncbi:FAD-binding oxidoreductase [Roseomonas sp. 573]|uniref:FAD-binding oxidoreductase n=2 Tax=Roseomonas haemaphysalidis TaxID=2768162 RepID=A0ABS3KJJ0_9PROT|nr:FAD-binding oxidoreductase [Roseomonas haemaphysalidis]